MKNVVEFPLADGGSVLVEVEDTGQPGATRRGLTPGAVVERAQMSLDDAVEKIQPIAAAMIGKLRGMAQAPDEVEVEFGLSLSAQAGAVLAAASTTANYKVTLTWRQPKEG